VGEGLGEVTLLLLVYVGRRNRVEKVGEKGEEETYPMTPMEDRARPSLLFWSRKTVLRRWKMAST
jgi:hypothetical protein